jgi:hypothetical protein
LPGLGSPVMTRGRSLALQSPPMPSRGPRAKFNVRLLSQLARLRRGRSGGQWPGRDPPFEIEFGHFLLRRKPGPVSLELWRELGPHHRRSRCILSNQSAEPPQHHCRPFSMKPSEQAPCIRHWMPPNAIKRGFLHVSGFHPHTERQALGMHRPPRRHGNSNGRGSGSW